MKRELKFRAFYEETMYQVTEIMWSNDTAYLYEPSEDEEGSGFIMPLADIQLMQFTGLKDKNGKEIYEGDIVRGNFGNRFGSYQEMTGSVFYNTARAEFAIERPNNDDDAWTIGVNSEVIGNVHETPDLLK